MKPLSNRLRKTYGVSRSEAKGMVALIVLSAILVASTISIRYIRFSNNTITPMDQLVLDSLVASMDIPEQKTPHLSDCPEVVLINPNTCSTQDFICAGLPDYIAKRVIKYRTKGGSFKVKSDLKKIYGLSDENYELITSKIDLPDYYKEKKHHSSKISTTHNEPGSFSRININTTDTTQLKKLPGIGRVLASRIIKFRDKLGGFHSIDQLRNVYGLNANTLNKLLSICYTEPDFEPLKIDINRCSFKEIISHPLVDYNLAKSIIGLREKFGGFSELEELLNRNVISEDKFKQLKPYLTLSN